MSAIRMHGLHSVTMSTVDTITTTTQHNLVHFYVIVLMTLELQLTVSYTACTAHLYECF